MKKIYHYTRYEHAISILESGIIKPATAFIDPQEIPAVWLSTSSTWERTATPMIGNANGRRKMELSELISITKLARFEIDPSAVTLIYPKQIRTSLKISRRSFSGLLDCAKEDKAKSSEWLVVKGSIPISACIRLELASSIDPFDWTELSGD